MSYPEGPASWNPAFRQASSTDHTSAWEYAAMQTEIVPERESLKVPATTSYSSTTAQPQAVANPDFTAEPEREAWAEELEDEEALPAQVRGNTETIPQDNSSTLAATSGLSTSIDLLQVNLVTGIPTAVAEEREHEQLMQPQISPGAREADEVAIEGTQTEPPVEQPESGFGLNTDDTEQKDNETWEQHHIAQWMTEDDAAKDTQPLYEYQSQPNEVEEALQEAPTTSLLPPDNIYENETPSIEESVSTILPSQSGLSDREPEISAASLAPEEQNHQADSAFLWATQGGDDDTDDFFAQSSAAQNDGLGMQDTAPAARSEDVETLASGTGSQAPENGIEDMWAAAFDDDDLLEEPATVEVDPSGFFDDDDDAGFLDDSTALSSSQPPVPTVHDGQTIFGITSLHSPQSTSRYQPSQVPAQHLSQSVDPRPASTPMSFFPSAGGHFTDSINAALAPSATPRPGPKSSSSFADRSKSGYASPYDLPTDIVAPRKRAAVHAAPIPQHQQGPPQAPPRSSSVPHPLSPTRTNATPQLVSQNKASPSRTDFFADLPVAAKSKPRPVAATPPPAAAFMPPPSFNRAVTQPTGPPTMTAPTSSFAGLQQPARLPLYPESSSSGLRTDHSSPPAASIPSARYSPAPAPVPHPQAPAGRFSPAPPVSSAQNRYSAAPNTSNATTRGVHFVPKTSSPLAYHDDLSTSKGRSLAPTSGYVEQPPQSMPDRTMTPPQTLPKSISLQSSPRHATKYAPLGHTASVGSLSPPRRSKTQSPQQIQRATSAYTALPHRQVPISFQLATQAGSQLSLPSKRQFSSDLNFDIPHDERSADHLERWKGNAIIHWSPNGTLLTSFPRQTPFYAAGHAIPKIKCTPGPVIIHDTKASLSFQNGNEVFPGPLHGKGKGKKKDVLAWMATKIELLEKQLQDVLLDASTDRQYRQRSEEKIVLWKVMRLIIENDNVLDGKSGVDEALRRLLVPHNIDDNSPINLVNVPAADTDPMAIQEIRKLLFEGQRERAVWLATEKHLWSHAMLIASTMGPALWKQLTHEFVKSQVQSQDHGTRSLTALYQIFAGNYEESIDELVPPFARAGFAMINSSGGLDSGGANSEGLEKWRETLALIISNRSSNDGRGIMALGGLLAGYGRVEAAHICYLLAKPHATYGGADDSEVSFSLLGADSKSQAMPLGSDLDSIVLTEIFEYAQSLTPTPGASNVLPHLQPFKFMHAVQLAEYGLRSEAQAYCDSIFSAIKSTTKASPYYHTAFTTAVDDLSRCLTSAPQSSTSAGLFAKMSSDKVSGSMWKKFNSFVAGEDDETASNVSGQGEGAESGPFGKVNGNSPAISRAPSTADLYGAMSAGQSATGLTGFTSPLSPAHMAGSASQPLAAAPSLDRTSSGRYAPSGVLQQPVRSFSGARPYEPQRSASAYTPLAAAARVSAKSYAPAGAELRQTSYTPAPASAVRPDVARNATDPQAVYSSPTNGITSPQHQVAVNQNLSRSSSPYQPSAYQSQSARSYVPVNPGLTQNTAQTSDSSVNGTAQYQQVQSSYLPPSAIHDDSTAPASSDKLRAYSASPQQSHPTPQLSHEVPLSSDEHDTISSMEKPDLASEEGQSLGSYNPPQAEYAPHGFSHELPQPSYEPSQGGYEPPQASYEPPSAQYTTEEPSFDAEDGAATSFQPAAGTKSSYQSSYQPYEPNYINDDPVDEEQSAPKPKKKSFMDLSDDDESFPGARPPPAQSSSYQNGISQPPSFDADAAAIKARQKAEADAAADEAFRKAAEADAERDKLAKDIAAKKGWFGGWFGGKKDGASPGADGSGAGPGSGPSTTGEPPQKAIRAKLGEDSSFYFDKELGKWVNGKASKEDRDKAAQAGARSTPPPPRAGPPSAAPSGPPSRPSTAGPPGPPGVSRAGTPGSAPPSRLSTAAAAGGPPGAGPARAGLSNAASIDDLLGGPPGPKKGGVGGTVKGKKRGGRYVDVIAKPGP